MQRISKNENFRICKCGKVLGVTCGHGKNKGKHLSSNWWRTATEEQKEQRVGGMVKRSRSKEGKEQSRKNRIKYNKSEEHKLVVSKVGKIWGSVNLTKYNQSEEHRLVAKEVGKVCGPKNLANYNRSEKGRETSRRNGREVGAENFKNWNESEEGKAFHSKVLTDYNKSEEHKDVAVKVLAQFKLPTKSSLILSKALTEVGIEHRLEQWAGKVRRIIDIAIFSPKIAIEVDGSSHTDPIFCTKEEKIVDDKLKDEQLSSLGWKVIRFTNEEVKNNLDTVVEKIRKEVRNICHQQEL